MQNQTQNTHVTKSSPSLGIVHTLICMISTLHNCRNRSENDYDHSVPQATCPSFLHLHQPLSLSEDQVWQSFTTLLILSSNRECPSHNPRQRACVKCDSLSDFCFLYFWLPTYRGSRTAPIQVIPPLTTEQWFSNCGPGALGPWEYHRASEGHLRELEKIKKSGLLCPSLLLVPPQQFCFFPY